MLYLTRRNLFESDDDDVLTVGYQVHKYGWISQLISLEYMSSAHALSTSRAYNFWHHGISVWWISSIVFSFWDEYATGLPCLAAWQVIF